MSSNQSSNIEQEMTRFFRAFEISTEYGEMKYSNKPLIHHLPKLIKGWVEYQFLSYYFTDVPKWRVFVRKLFSTERIAPDYVMTGPSKGGSSDLVSHLLLHPNVMHPLVKEVRLDNNKNWRFHYPTEKEKQQLMKKNGKRIRCGYLDPTLNRLSVMNTLYDLNPECKVIITLRNPVARAYSYWKWEVFRGGERLKNNKNGEYFKSFSEYIERALDLFPSLRMETVTGGLVLENGIYYKAVEHWINRFGRENVLVLDVAEYFSNRQPTLEKIQKFLDLPVVNIPEYGKKANENPIKLPPPEQKTKSLLAEFYQPYNQKLFDLIETEFNWQ